MTDTATRARIAALPEDAPATAVLAAWAGKDFNRFDYTKNPVTHEGTVRLWLLDGGMEFREFKSDDVYFQEIHGHISDDERAPDLIVKIGDTPEAAFTAAYEKFAEALREMVKNDA